MKYFVGLMSIVFAAVKTHGQWQQQLSETPAYHIAAPGKGETLPPIMTQAQLAQAGFTMPAQKESYKAAAKVGSVLYQQPCYCHCDKHAGHTSLRSCFEGLHGTECSTCAKEGLYAYRMTKQGKAPAEIRAGIARHDYESIDLEKQ